MIGVVLVRAVADTEAPLGGADRRLILDPGSLVALGQALSWRAGVGDGRLAGLSAGPDSWDQPLREALALGLDEVRRVALDGDLYTDVASTAAALAMAVPADLTAIFAGCSAADHGSGALPAALAALLDLPLVSEVTALRVEGGNVFAKVRAGGGRYVTYRVEEPAMFVAAALPPPPLYPPLASRLAAQRAAIGLCELPSDSARPAAQTRFLGFGPARPRTRHLLTPQASAPAGDRLSQLMAGGMSGRTADKLAGSGADLARGLVDLLEREGLLDIRGPAP
jgi:electron transfer flavoprotein alpha/beta subunit